MRVDGANRTADDDPVRAAYCAGLKDGRGGKIWREEVRPPLATLIHQRLEESLSRDWTTCDVDRIANPARFERLWH